MALPITEAGWLWLIQASFREIRCLPENVRPGTARNGQAARSRPCRWRSPGSTEPAFPVNACRRESPGFTQILDLPSTLSEYSHFGHKDALKQHMLFGMTEHLLAVPIIQPCAERGLYRHASLGHAELRLGTLS
jgi:hypothetical protein